MGTFTLRYFFKQAVLSKPKTKLIGYPVAVYLACCYYGYMVEKRSMLKGQSKMFARRREEILAWDPHADIWAY